MRKIRLNKIISVMLALIIMSALTVTALADGPGSAPESQYYDREHFFLTSASNATWKLNYTYDAQGRLYQEISTSEMMPYIITYTYDSNDRIVKSVRVYDVDSTLYKNTDVFTYSYDGNGRLKEIQTDDVYNAKYVFAYDAAGNLISKTYVYVGTNFDTGLKQEFSSDVGSYTYDFNGRMLTYTNEYDTTYTYQYDGSGHRISATGNDGTFYKYTYDSNGNHVVTAELIGDDFFTADEFTYIEAPAKSDSPFKDVAASQYYYEAVKWAVDKNITSGTSVTTFSPNNDCTRGQVVTFLWRAKGSPEPKITANPFSDVKTSDYFYKAVMWALENNITSGTSATTFSPNDKCTRGQVVTFLWRTEKMPAVSGSNSFGDVGSNDYFTNAVNWAVKNDITSGTSTTTFSPDIVCTRGQVVTFLWRDLK